MFSPLVRSWTSPGVRVPPLIKSNFDYRVLTNKIQKCSFKNFRYKFCMNEKAKGSIHIWRQMFFGHFWPTYLPYNQMVYFIDLFSKIRCSLTYLPTQKSDLICECSLWQIEPLFVQLKWNMGEILAFLA